MTEHHDKQEPTESNRPKVFRTAFDTPIAGVAFRHIVILGNLLGVLLYFVDIPHRRVVRRNLQFVRPHWSLEQVKIFSKQNFQNLALTFLEIFQIASLSCEEIMDRITIKGEGHIRRALEQNQGLILISAHLGNWEAGLQFMSCFCKTPITGVAKKIRFKPLHRWLHRLRNRFGIKIVDKKGALPHMRQALRRGEVIGFLVDQSRRSEGVDVHFLGKRVTAPSAPAFLALRCKSPVLPIFCVRDQDRRIQIQVGAPLKLHRSGDLRADLIANTQIMTDVVESAVRAYPEQWLWMHKRWKKHYPQLYPEYNARRQRRKLRKQRRSSAYRQKY